MKADCCSSCGVPFVDHLGIQGTCEQLRAARVVAKFNAESVKRLLAERTAMRRALRALVTAYEDNVHGGCPASVRAKRLLSKKP